MKDHASPTLHSIIQPDQIRSLLIRWAGAILLLGHVVNSSFASPNVLTWHNDLTRTGQNTNETLLTPANVNTNSFGLLFTCPVDGQVYAQPLYVSGVVIPGQGTHNVVFVATEHNSLYAFDADTNASPNGGLLWQVNFGPSASSASRDFGIRNGTFRDLTPEVGITSTPVIDLASGTIYVDALTHEGSSYFHKIHALNITNGIERSFSPVVVTGSVHGNGVDSTNGVVTFNAVQQIQRPALTLAGGIIYLAFAGYADSDPYHGWVIGFSATNLLQLTNYVFNTTPNSTVAEFGTNAGEGGIWMSGSGLAVDSKTNLFVVVGNGSFYLAGDAGTEFGDSVVKLSVTNGLSVLDFFTPFNQLNLADTDSDLGSGGPLLLPDSVGSVAHPHLMVACGKEGRVYLLDRDNLGQYNAANGATNDPQIVEELPPHTSDTWSSPAYFNNCLYISGSSDVLRAFALTNGLLTQRQLSQSPFFIGFPGATPAISANGTNNAILWIIESDAYKTAGPAVLHALDANNLANEFYNSSQAGTRDFPGPAVKFTVPTIVNGKVYVGADHAISVFGNGSFLGLPALNLTGGFFTNSVSITISQPAPVSPLYYTLDGSVPTTNSTVYTGPFLLTNSAVLNVRALKSGSVPSQVISATFINAATYFVPDYVKQEFYPGAVLTNLENPAYTNAAAYVQYFPAFETPSSPTNNYGERVSALFIPPVTTNYVFFIASDDQAGLFLSTDSTPANKHLIAQETAWSFGREWVTSGGGSVVASKRSDQFANTAWPGGNTIQLTAGTPYYIESDRQKLTGGDNLAVTFIFAGAPGPAYGTPPALTGNVIGALALQNTILTLNSQPQNAVAFKNTTASFSVGATSAYLGQPSLAGPEITYQWQCAAAGSLTFTNVPGATNATYTTPPLTLAQSGVEFRAMISAIGAPATNSSAATLIVLQDFRPPAPVVVTYVSADARTVEVGFSEPLDPNSAGTRQNYVCTPGNLVPASASLDNSGTTLTLTFANPLPQDTTITLGITHVSNTDDVSVAPGTSISFSFGEAASTFAGGVLADGPLAYWRLNEISGLTAFDSAGLRNGTYGNAVLHGLAGLVADGFLGFENGDFTSTFFPNNANSFVSVPALNLNTNTVTFLAWINPSGAQADYTGLLTTRLGGTQAGFGFSTNNQLNYTWNDNTTYSFATGLVPPTNIWSLVATVITPTNAILYLINTNGTRSVTNAIPHTSEVWAGTAFIGTDTSLGGGVQAFNGLMSDVAIFKQSLASGAIASLYQMATLGGAIVTNALVLPAGPRFSSINFVGGQIALQWSGNATLQESTNPAGPWTNSVVQGSPLVEPMTSQKFFRLQQ